MRRGLVRAAAAALLIAIAIASVYAARVASVLVAYKAKQLCSGVFVAGRDAGSVIAELEVDDLELLRYVDARVDMSNRTASATALGLITREAAYRGSTGCALVLDGRAPGTFSDAAASIRAAPTLEQAADGRLERVLDVAFAEPDPDRLQRTRAVVVVQNGRVVAERYAPGIERETPLIGWSMTKSVMNALTGILVRQGRWSVDHAVPIREWQAPDDSRHGITLDHLLHMSSGLRFDEEMITPLTDVVYMLLAVPDMAAYAAGKPLDAAPGTTWQYSSGTTVILARAIRNVIGDDRAYLDFPRHALFDRLDMSSAVIETDAAGTFVGSSLVRHRTRLGAVRDAVSPGRRLERGAHPAGRMDRVHADAGPRGRGAPVRRALLARRARRLSAIRRHAAPRRVSRRRASGPVRDHRPVAEGRHRTAWRHAAPRRVGSHRLRARRARGARRAVMAG